MRHPTLNRRQLLRGALTLGGGAAALAGFGPFTRLARADAGRDLHYVFAYFGGGWDILLSLDPRDPATFTNDNVRNTLIQPAFDLLDAGDSRLIEAGGITFGPYIGDLAQHASKLAVVRGMSMETLTHEAGRRRFITGKPPSGLQARGSSAATVLAARLGRSQPIPNLAIQVESYNVDQPNYATALKADGVPDLIRALRPSNPDLGPRQAAQLDHLLSQVAQCEGAQRSSTWRAAEAGRQKAREMTVGGLDHLFDFFAPGEAMEAIRDHYRIPANDRRAPEVQSAMAAQAIKGGVSRVVSIQVANGLDTHFAEWATDQGPRQRQGFNAIARLIEDLERSEYGSTGESWLDHTVIVGFSEFSRTPMLNARDGRDHSLTNACFLAGAGIAGGVAVGRSSDRGMEPLAVDLGTGRPDPGGEVVRPEHVLQALLRDAGFEGDEADLRVPPLDAIRRWR